MNLNENITGLQHIGIPTLVIDKTIEFYESLGFKVIQRESLEDGSKVAFLELNKLIIETWENKSNFNEIGVIDHIALDVCDIEAAFKDCKENKLTILNKNIEFYENRLKENLSDNIKKCIINRIQLMKAFNDEKYVTMLVLVESRHKDLFLSMTRDFLNVNLISGKKLLNILDMLNNEMS